jgi:hypothetical protein
MDQRMLVELLILILGQNVIYKNVELIPPLRVTDNNGNKNSTKPPLLQLKTKLHQ